MPVETPAFLPGGNNKHCLLPLILTWYTVASLEVEAGRLWKGGRQKECLEDTGGRKEEASNERREEEEA